MQLAHKGLPDRQSGPDSMKADTGWFNVTTSWQEGMTSQSLFKPCIINGNTQAASSYVVYSDGPGALDGNGHYPNPQELMLVAFNACMTATFLTEAAKAGLVLNTFKIETSGEFTLTLIEPHSPQSADEAIRYLITVSGPASVAQFDEVHQAVITHSINRWALAGSCLIEGDLTVAPEIEHQ